MARSRLPLALLPLVLTYLAVAMNLTIANVALPTISLDLDATAGELTWVVNATPVMSGALILFAGALGDRVGHRRMLLIGIAVFTVSASATVFVTNIEQLIALRALTGIGSAVAMPSALALTFAVARGASQRTAVGIMGATQAIGAMLGPIVGGAVLVAFGWPAAFLSVVPMLLAAFIGILWLLPASIAGRPAPGSTPTQLDSFGSALAALTVVALLVAAVAATSTSPADDWQILAGLLVGVLAGVGLVLWERHTATPLFRAEIIRRRSYWVPTVALGYVQFTLGGLLFVSTQYLQLVLGYSAFGAAVLLIPALVVWTATAASAGMAANRLGLKAATVASLLISAVGFAMLSRAGADPTVAFLIVAMLVTGAMGLTPALMTHTAVNNYPGDMRGTGAALNSVVLRFGMAFGVAAYGAILTRTFLRNTQGSNQADGVPDPAQTLGGTLRIAEQIGGPAGADLALSAREAFVAGFSVVMAVGAGILVAVGVLVWLALPRDLPATAPPAEAPLTTNHEEGPHT